MALKYYLVDNHLHGLSGTKRAVTLTGKSYTFNDLIGIMLSHGSTLTRGEILATLEEFANALEGFLRRGYAVSLPLLRISPSIVGVFRNMDDQFDPSRHRVKLMVRAGERLKSVETQIAVEKITGQRTTPVLLRFHDHVTGEINSIATAGGLARIGGRLLKFDEDDTRQGVFFINASNASMVWIGGKFLRNTGGELIFQLPANIPAGLYRVEVRTVYKGNKRVRAGVLPVELTVLP